MSNLRLTFGTEFRKRRVARSLSIYDAAAQLGISPSSLGAYERGERWPGPDALEALLHLYYPDGASSIFGAQESNWGRAVELAEDLLKELRK